MPIEWEEIDPASLPDDSNAPKYCDDGPFSHTWWFELDYDGFGIWCEECEMCDAVAQSAYADLGEHLVATFKVRLTPRVEEYIHSEGREVDYFIDMEPVHEEPDHECRPG